MITYDNFDTLIKKTKFAREGLLLQLARDNDALIDEYRSLAKKCLILDDDDETEYIFKTFILCGGMKNMVDQTRMQSNKISDTIFYKRSKDIDITLFAKSLYYTGRTSFKGYLEYIINKIIENGDVDMEEEYKKYFRRD